jgi:hypothetical protein
MMQAAFVLRLVSNFRLEKMRAARLLCGLRRWGSLAAAAAGAAASAISCDASPAVPRVAPAAPVPIPASLSDDPRAAAVRAASGRQAFTGDIRADMEALVLRLQDEICDVRRRRDA